MKITAPNLTSILFLFTTVASFIGPLKGIGLALEGFLGIKGGFGFLAIIQSQAGFFTKIFRLVYVAFADFLPVAAAFLFFFQVISRAIAIAHITDAIQAFNLIPKAMLIFTQMKVALSNIMLPVYMAIDGLANLIAPLFTNTILFKLLLHSMSGLAKILGGVGWLVVRITGAFAGLISVVAGFFMDLNNGYNPMKNIKSNFVAGYDDFLKQNEARMGKTGDAAAKYTVNNTNHVTARFDMREQMEPDRIAFSVVQHLKKLTINPREAAGSSFGHAFGQPRFAGSQ